MYKPPKEPISTARYFGGGIAIMAVLMVVVVGGDLWPDAGYEPAPTIKDKKDDEACFRDASCIGNRKVATAGVLCAREVEALAKYSHEWTDGTFEMKFSHYRWKDQAGGWMTFLGDKVKFQNGFGAWQNMVYSCDVNVRTDNVGAVSARPGRL